jgi:acetate---CoA ligase (ADP-forming)
LARKGGRIVESGSISFEHLFNPRSVAIVGASPHDLATLAQMSTKIKDRIFLVNPKYSEVRGKKCYPSLSAVDHEIDYVILIVPAGLILQVLEECIQKGVKFAQIYTAGFSETGIPERIDLEKEL